MVKSHNNQPAQLLCQVTKAARPFAAQPYVSCLPVKPRKVFIGNSCIWRLMISVLMFFCLKILLSPITRYATVSYG